MSQDSHEISRDILPRRLKDHFTNRIPCEVTCGDMQLVVYVASIGTDVAIGRRVDISARKFCGWFAFRLNAVEDLKTPVDAADIETSMSVVNERLPPKLPLKAGTMEQLAIRVGRFFPIVIINGASSGDGTDGIAGTVVDVDRGTVVLREMSTRFEWMPDLLHVPLCQIKYFLFGSQYENDLTQFGDMNDRLEWMKQTLESIRRADDQV